LGMGTKFVPMQLSIVYLSMMISLLFFITGGR